MLLFNWWNINTLTNVATFDFTINGQALPSVPSPLPPHQFNGSIALPVPLAALKPDAPQSIGLSFSDYNMVANVNIVLVSAAGVP